MYKLVYAINNIPGAPVHQTIVSGVFLYCSVLLKILNILLVKRSYGIWQLLLMSTKPTTTADNTHFQNSPVQYKPIQKTLVPATS